MSLIAAARGGMGAAAGAWYRCRPFSRSRPELSDPVILAWEWDAGKVGAAQLFRARATVGANLRHFEVYTGVDYLDIEDTSLTAMITGLRTWW